MRTTQNAAVASASDSSTYTELGTLIVHVPFGYLPDTLGGTEIYVASLANHLVDRGVASVVVAPGQRAEYVHNGIPVRRITHSSGLSLEALYGDGDPEAAVAFGRALDAICPAPTLVHMHALTAGASLAAMREAVRRRLPVIMTYHTPTVTCLRGTMLRWGDIPCDGQMLVTRCAACALHGRGLPKWLANLVARLPEPLSRAAARRLPSKLATALGMRWLTAIRHRAVRSAFGLCSYVVSPCNWVTEVLVRNGVPVAKLVLSRQGLPQLVATSNGERHGAGDDAANSGKRRSGPLRLVFLGRIDPTKGLHTLLRALALRPELAVALTIYGTQGVDSGYVRQILALAAADKRVELCEPLANVQVVEAVSTFDAVVVPSEWLETGPLVVYEAFAAGVPVLGSNLGGIAELVNERVNGRLLAPGDAAAWAAAIAEIVDNRTLIQIWQQNLPSVRTMREVSIDMRNVYDNALTPQATPCSIRKAL